MPKDTVVVYLTRRNLLSLLAKLNTVAVGGHSECSLVKKDNKHAKYPQTHAHIFVQGIEDEEYYDRPAGYVGEDLSDEQGIVAAANERG